MAKIIRFPAQPQSDEPVVVEAGSGWWKGKGGYRISRPGEIDIDAQKLKQALADCDEVARACGWTE